MFKLRQIKCYYKHLQNLPGYFPRNMNDLNIITVKHEFATKCILYSIPKCVYSLPPLIKDKFDIAIQEL